MSTTNTQVQPPAEAAVAERPATKRVFMPRADVYETPEQVVILADMPGVDSNSVDITLDKNVLTLTGNVPAPAQGTPQYQEYDVGDYKRSFKLTEGLSRDGIEASVKHGVLKVTVRKAGPAPAKKIAVKAE